MDYILARCKKSTYTWEGDGEQHTIDSRLVVGNVYAFDLEDGTYWLNRHKSPDVADFVNENGYIIGNQRGLPKKYFDEMFTIL
jgi:hypothetical protein